MKKLIIPIFLFLFTFSISAQDKKPEEVICIPISVAEKANKAFDEIKESRPLIAQLLQDKADFIDQLSQSKVENTNLKTDVKSLKDKDLERQKQIKILEEQKCSTISFLFGLIKYKKC